MKKKQILFLRGYGADRGCPVTSGGDDSQGFTGLTGGKTGKHVSLPAVKEPS